MATIGEMIVKLLADTSNFNTSMDEAAAKVTASSDAMAASMATSMQSFRNFDAITKESVKSTEGLAEAQAALQAVQQTGAFTAEELAAKQALVDAAMLKVGKETEAASGALAGFTSNSRTMYSASALITDAMTGQFSRMRREVAALANETGAMSAAFRLMLGPIGGVVVAAGAVAVALLHGEEESSKFADSLIATGNYAGTTEGAMNALAESIAGGATTIGAARGVVLQFAESGRFTHDQLQLASEAAVSFANVAHVSMDEAVQAIVRIQEDPVAALQKLNEQYHFVNQAQLDAVASLVKQGETTKAVSLAIEDFGNVMHTRAVQAEQDVGYMEEAWRGLKNVISDTVNWMEQAGRKVTLQAQLEEADHDLQLIRDHGETVGRMIIGMEATGSKLFSDPANYTVDKLTAKVHGLQEQIMAANMAASAQGNATAANTTTKPHSGSVGIGDLESQFQQQEATARASYDQMKQDAADFWNAQATDARNSAAVQAAAWQKYIDARHQLDEQGLRNESEADRQREQSALKAAEAAKRAAEERARAEKQASAEIQQEVQKENALQLRDAEGAQQIARKRIEIDRQALQNQYDAHQINAQQLLQGQLRLDDELLAAELAYLNKKKELDAGDVAAVARDQQQITLAVLEADQRRLQDEDKTLKTSEQRWKQYGQRIAGAVQNSFNSMLFQGQKLKNGLASVAESILETFLENVVEQPLQAFIAGEGQKLAAAIGFGAQKTATENAQRATNAAADVADKTAASARAAGLAGAQGVASFAAAPWPIDIGAPAFGAAMMASALSFGAMASAAGGWERVPADGMLTELHRDEMVLPKHVADPMRNMARNGGGNGGGAIHIHATDAASFKDFLRRNPGVLAGGMRFAAARGHF